MWNDSNVVMGGGWLWLVVGKHRGDGGKCASGSERVVVMRVVMVVVVELAMMVVGREVVR